MRSIRISSAYVLDGLILNLEDSWTADNKQALVGMGYRIGDLGKVTSLFFPVKWAHGSQRDAEENYLPSTLFRLMCMSVKENNEIKTVTMMLSGRADTPPFGCGTEEGHS